MSKRAIQWAKRIGIVFFGLIILLLGTMYIVPIIFKDRINTEVQKLLSDNIIGEVSFSDMNVSFFTRFPYLTASIESVNIRGNEVQNGQVEDLISAKEFSLGINLMDLISSKISFNRVYLEQPVVNLEVDSLGNANYMVFKSSDSESSSSPFSLEIDELVIRKGNIKYTDNSAQFYFKGSNLEYIGSGKMEDVLFSLKSKLSISSFDLRYDDVYYVKDKPIGAALETLIDTKSLTFEFQKNDLKIKNLLVNFVGRFGFVENGYDMLFDIKAKDAGLGDLLSVVPPEYQKWLDSTQFDGKVNGDVKLEGQFLSLDTIRPTLALNLHLADGRIQHNGVANPLDKLTMDFSYKMPSLDLEKSEIDLNKLNFAIGNKTSDLKLHVTGFTEPTINGNFDVDTDLALLHDAIGLTAFEMKGDFTFKGDVDGKFARGVKVTKTLRRTTQDTVVVSIPKLALSGGLKNGYFKMDNLPEALENINLTYTILGETEKYQDVKVAINDIDFIAMDNYVRGYFKLNNLSTFDVDTKLEADVDLGNIKKYLPLTDIVLDGTIQLDGTMKGSYEPKRKKFPVVDAKVTCFYDGKY